MDHGVGDQFAGEHHGVVDDVGEAPALEGVTDEASGTRDGSSDGIEAGGRARGDHRTPRPVLDGHGSLAGRLVPLVRQAVRRPWVRGCSPGSVRWSCCAAAPPMPARLRATAQAGRAGVAGQPQARLLTFAVRADAGLQCFRPRCSPSGGCADDVRSCRTVMAWFRGGETLGRLVGKVRAGSVVTAPGGQQPPGGASERRAGHLSQTGKARQRREHPGGCHRAQR